jgi:hypothetical protein
VQKHQRLAGASFHVVQPDTIDVKELAGWRVILLCLLRKLTVQKGCRRQRSCRNHGGKRIGVARCDLPAGSCSHQGRLHEISGIREMLQCRLNHRRRDRSSLTESWK